MASAIVDALVPRLRQTTATAGKAAAVLRAAFPDASPSPSTSSRRSSDAIEVWLPRKKAPTYVLANQQVQPWELLPMKSAAMAQYPNFFNNSCVFFGSIKRDVVGGLQHCLVRPTKLAIDLAKVTRNLGIIEGFEVVQKHQRLGEHDFVWQRGVEPQDVRDVKLFKHALLKLHLRSDLYSLRAQDAYRRPAASAAAASATGAVEDEGHAAEATSSRMDTDAHGLVAEATDRSAGSAASTSSDPHDQATVRRPRRMGLATVHGQLPLSVKNISKASQPVMMYPSQLHELRQRLPSGVWPPCSSTARPLTMHMPIASHASNAPDSWQAIDPTILKALARMHMPHHEHYPSTMHATCSRHLSCRHPPPPSRRVCMPPCAPLPRMAPSPSPAGIFIMYHHELGLITDAQAEQYDVPALAAAHLGLPLGMVVQIRGAMRRKAAQESGRPLRHVTPLKVRSTAWQRHRSACLSMRTTARMPRLHAQTAGEGSGCGLGSGACGQARVPMCGADDIRGHSTHSRVLACRNGHCMGTVACRQVCVALTASRVRPAAFACCLLTQDWDMVEHVQSEVEARRKLMNHGASTSARDLLRKQAGEEWSQIYDSVKELDISQKLDDELLAWQVGAPVGGLVMCAACVWGGGSGEGPWQAVECTNWRRSGDAAGMQRMQAGQSQEVVRIPCAHICAMDAYVCIVGMQRHQLTCRCLQLAVRRACTRSAAAVRVAGINRCACCCRAAGVPHAGQGQCCGRGVHDLCGEQGRCRAGHGQSGLLRWAPPRWRGCGCRV